MPKKKLKWFYLCQEIKDGAREYSNIWIEQYYSEKEAREANEEELDDFGLDDNGETATTLYDVREITDAEYKVLSNFI